ncbi:hypothetical protein HDU97_005115 [Phlyctochytrium planicorne]|nr:hypothetical protein HDU97_005115 [Phlyctochytrium planicorne]
MAEIKFRDPADCSKLYDCSTPLAESVCNWTGSRYQCTLNSGYVATIDGPNTNFTANSILCSPAIAGLKSGTECKSFQAVIAVPGKSAYSVLIEKKTSGAERKAVSLVGWMCAGLALVMILGA